MSKTRLAALFAVFLVAIAASAVAGCGGSDDSSSTSGGETSASTEESGGGGEPLTVGSDIPYPPFEQGKPGEYTGFDIELMDAIGAKIGRTPEFEDTSFETIFRDVAQDAYEPNRLFARALDVTSFLGTPLNSKGRTVGVLAVDNRLSGR